VYVPDLEAGTLARQAAGAKGREAASMSKSGERVGLIHELAELARPEELFDRGHHGADVDERLRRDGLDVLGRHALLDHSLHTREPYADLVLEKLAHRTHPAVAEVIDVVGLVLGIIGVELDQVANGPEQILLAEHRAHLRDSALVVAEAELLVGLVSPHPREVVALRVKEQVVEQAAGALHRRRLAGSQLAVDVD